MNLSLIFAVLVVCRCLALSLNIPADAHLDLDIDLNALLNAVPSHHSLHSAVQQALGKSWITDFPSPYRGRDEALRSFRSSSATTSSSNSTGSSRTSSSSRSNGETQVSLTSTGEDIADRRSGPSTKSIFISNTTFSASSSVYRVFVANSTDMLSPNCTFTSSVSDSTSYSQCSLRGAWELCKTVKSITNKLGSCEISLAANLEIVFELSRGPLVLEGFDDITIVGNQAIVYGTGTRQWLEHVSLVRRLYYNPVGSATKTQETMYFRGCSGTQFIFSSCNNETTGDTLLNLWDDTHQIDFSNSACGFRSMVIYTIPYGEDDEMQCIDFSLKAGCYEDEECVMRLDAFSLLRNQTWDHQFILYEESSQAASLTLLNFTVKSFGSISTDGGALSIHGAAIVFISDMIFEGNIGYRGGAISFLYNGTLSVSNSTFIDNQSLFAGGSIFIGEAFNGSIIERVTFNRSSSIYDNGGAIGLEKTYHVVMSDITTDNCFAVLKGGSIYMNQSQYVSVRNALIMNSVASGGGGAIYEAFGLFTSLVDLVIVNSQSEVGGAILGYISIYSTWENIVITKSVVTQYGGGTFCLGCGAYTIKNIQISDASALIGGGAGFYACQYIFLQNAYIVQSTATKYGGGLYINIVENALFQSVYIAYCHTDTGKGGGIFLLSCLNIGFGLIEVDSSVAFHGGGMYISESEDVNIVGVKIENCASTDDGGGLYIDNQNKNIALAAVLLFDNRAVQNGGGAYVSSSNSYVSWLDYDSYLNKVTFEAAASTKNLTVSFPGASGIMFYFDESSLLNPDWNYCCTRLLIMHDDELVFSGHYAVDLPGIDTAPMISNYNTLNIEFHNYENAEQNSVKLYVIPIYSNPDSPCEIRRNVAVLDGGGLMISHVNPVSISLNTIVQDNIAQTGNGGGLLLETANTKSLFAHTMFSNNSADGNGGGVFVGFSHYSTNFRWCTFQSNLAGGDGGGQYVSSNNGMGTLDTGNELTCVDCTFMFNNASVGGALYLEDENDYVLINSTLNRNIAETGEGGGIVIGSRNQLGIRNTIVGDNQANAGCGGGFAVLRNDNDVVILNSVLLSNKALNGGAFCIKATTNLEMEGRVLIQSNIAIDAGGGGVIASSSLWKPVRGELLFSLNTAQRGSALFLHEVPTALDAISNVSFVANNATRGTTIFWIYSDSMHEPPADFLNIDASNWQDNVESYGTRISTQPVKVESLVGYNVTNFGQPLDPPLTVTIKDQHDQVISVNGYPYVSVAITSHNCRENSRPYIAGTDAAASGIAVENGVATFSDLRVFCYPEGSMNIAFTVPVDPLEAIIASTESFDLVQTTTLSFRSCSVGEYNSNGNCVSCGVGSYNLDGKTNATCESCIGQIGVTSCVADKIFVTAGYWRRHNSTTTVLKCLLGSKSCPGGFGTGDYSCANGYAGPLCAICADGYYMSSGSCLQCGQANFTSMTIFLLIILVIFTAYCIVMIVLWWKKYSQQETPIITKIQDKLKWLRSVFGEVVVKVKIIVATFQVIISTADVFNVIMPGRFAAFSRAFTVLNLNIGSLIPFACASAWHFNFMFKLFWATITPLVVIFVLVVALHIEYFLVTPAKQESSRRDRSSSPSSSSSSSKAYYSELKSRYLNYIFYLTYLILPSVTTTIFQLFVCQNIDPNHEDNNNHDTYLVADVKISCNSDYYLKWKIYGIFMIVVYPIGIPLFYWICLYSYREDIKNRDAMLTLELERQNSALSPFNVSPIVRRYSSITDLRREVSQPMLLMHRAPSTAMLQSTMSKTALRMAFLWEAYKPEFWYWELVETSRRILLTAVLSVYQTGTTEQNVMGIIMAFIFMKIYSHFQPYVTFSDFRLAEVGQTQIVATYFAAVVVSAQLLRDGWNEAVGAALVTLNLSVIFLGLYYEIIAYLEDNPQTVEKATNAVQQKLQSLLISKSSDGKTPTPKGNTIFFPEEDVVMGSFKVGEHEHYLPVSLGDDELGLQLGEFKTDSLETSGESSKSCANRNLSMVDDDEQDDVWKVGSRPDQLEIIL